MSVLDKFLNAIRLNDDYDEDDEFFDEDDDIDDEDFEEEEPKSKKRFFKKMRDSEEEEVHSAKKTGSEACGRSFHGSRSFFRRSIQAAEDFLSQSYAYAPKSFRYRHGGLCDQAEFYGRYQGNRGYSLGKLYGCAESGGH